MGAGFTNNVNITGVSVVSLNEAYEYKQASYAGAENLNFDTCLVQHCKANNKAKNPDCDCGGDKDGVPTRLFTTSGGMGSDIRVDLYLVCVFNAVCVTIYIA